MNETSKKVPVAMESRDMPIMGWRPFETLRREIDRLFDEMDGEFWRTPFRASPFETAPLWRRSLMRAAAPAVDIIERPDCYELSAELPGMDEKSIEVKLANGGITLRGERQEDKEERRKDYYLHERHFGTFERSFALPADVDADRIEATMRKGILTLRLPKRAEAVKPVKKIEVKTAA